MQDMQTTMQDSREQLAISQHCELIRSARDQNHLLLETTPSHERRMDLRSSMRPMRRMKRVRKIIHFTESEDRELLELIKRYGSGYSRLLKVGQMMKKTQMECF